MKEIHRDKQVTHETRKWYFSPDPLADTIYFL
jgi:hypothetical protein